MGKGDSTREMIIAKAAELFNSQGFAGATLSALMKATGLKKGGIYNHFRNKEEIRIEAFRYMVNGVRLELMDVVRSESSAHAKLLAIIEFFRNYSMNPVIKGGCPLLNAMVDADNTDSDFLKSVNKAVDDLIREVADIVAAGIENGEFKAATDPQKAAIIILTSIEGGVAVSRNYTEKHYMDIVIDHLHDYVNSLSA